MNNSMVKEIPRNSASGYTALFILFGLLLLIVWFIYTAIQKESALLLFSTVIPSVLVFVLGVVGLFMVHPNQAKVLTLFGKYVGSARVTGLHCVAQ